MGTLQESKSTNAANNTVQDTWWLAPTSSVPDTALKTS